MPTLIQAPASKLAELKALQQEKRRREAERLSRVDVFSTLGYEPTCLPRHAVRKAVAAKLGVENPYDPALTAALEGKLPPPCGLCPQELFHAAAEDDVLYGGAAGGGKTIALVMEALRAVTKYPGIRVLMLRRTYDELAESFYPEFERLSWGAKLGGRWNKTDKQITFPNGSVIRLRYLDSLEDASKRQGGAYQLLLVDERTLMPPGVVDIIAKERLRSAHGVPVLGIRSASNPGGASHGEARVRYVDATEHGEKVVTDEHGLTVRFIPAKATDNPYLDEAYFRRLDSIADPARKAAMRDGDWAQFAGQMFTEYRWERHTIAPIDPPVSWTRYNGVDWGFAKPWAVVWAAVDEDGRAWFYRELYETQVGEADQARQILAAEAKNEVVAVRWADSAMWDTRGDAKPIADVYAENGVHLTKVEKGPGSRVTGWQRWHTYLKEGPACPHHRAMGWVTCPMVHISRTCAKLIWELENLPHAKKGNVEDADTEAADHAMDASRYLLINIGGGPQFLIFDDPAETILEAAGIEVLQDAGVYGVRPQDADALFGSDRDEDAGTTQKSPFA